MIAWGETRREAADRLGKALSEFHVEGIKTTILANLLILSSPKFLDGDLDTGFIEELYSKASPEQFSGKPLWPCM